MSVGFSFSHFSPSYFHLLLVGLLFRLCLSNTNNKIYDNVLCMDDERQALLDFKHALIDEANRLASWVPENKDCCTWTGIVCDNFTGHVHMIHIPSNYHHFDEDDTMESYKEGSKHRLRGDLSPSLLHLKHIKHLDLSGNDFGGIQIPSFMGSLGNLRYLNLSGSEFGGTIPPHLGNLTELRILFLGSFHNDDTGAYEHTRIMNMQWLSSLRWLHHLDTSGVDLSKSIDWFQVINTLPSLLELHMSHCRLVGIHPYVASLNLTSLSLLDLSRNQFTNASLPRWIFSITGLVSLDLSWCGFHGLVPNSIDSFRNLTSLEVLHVPRNVFMNSSLVLEGLSSIGSNLIVLDISYCGVSRSVLSALHNLTSLHTLDMSHNQLTEPIPKTLANVCNLRHLYLHYNNFSNISLASLLQSFFECKSPRLESLSLKSSGLSSQLPHELGQLMYIVDLQLGMNRISGMIPDSIGQLSFLRSLHLDENLISGPIPNSIRGLSSLELLDLSDNQLKDSLPDSVSQLPKLNTLVLSYNQLNGSLPHSIGQLSELIYLDLSYNQLKGNLPRSLGQLSELVFLDLSNNLLTGIVTKDHFAKLARLKVLAGTGNNLTLQSSFANWIPPFPLVILALGSWGLGPQFPLWVQMCRDLTFLDISNTRISSTMPESFWKSLPNLKHLDMSQNHIQGMLIGIPAALDLMNLSSNEFGGKLPQLSNTLLISVLDLSHNSFVGSLRHLLCPYGGESLRILNLANNHLSGAIPECWVKWPSLSFLSLENNNLSGRIPRTLGSLSSLRSLNMCSNKLSGRLPVCVKNLTSLQILQLARNELVGRIPAWFGRELSSLRILNLRSNNFDGHINDELCSLTAIQILDLADNNLSGNIPRCFNNFSVLTGKGTFPTDSLIFSLFDSTSEVLGSASLVIKRREDTYSTILGLVMVLDISNNNLSGHIPIELTTLKALQSLNLSINQLKGQIPEKIGDMKLLESFDVSQNQLSGKLPVSLSSLSFLSSFNVSYNSLTGRIPSSTQLHGFSESSFMGNKLCGDPLTQSCAIEVPDHRDEEEDDDRAHRADWGLIISIVSGFIVGFWVVIAPLIVSSRWRITYFRFFSEVRYMVCNEIE